MIGLAKKFVRVFPKILWKNPNELLGQSNTLKYSELIDNLRHSKATDQEMTAIGKIVCDSELPRGGGTPHHRGPQGGAPGSQKAERVRRKRGQEPLLWFPWEGPGQGG